MRKGYISHNNGKVANLNKSRKMGVLGGGGGKMGEKLQ